MVGSSDGDDRDRPEGDGHDLPEYVTARELIPLIRRKTGLPLTRGKLKNEVARGTGPPVVGRWGNCRLFDPRQGLEWRAAR